MKLSRYRVAVAAILLFAVAASCTGDEAPPRPAEGVVNIGTHSLRARTQGAGSPAVVVDTGIAAGMDEWEELQEALARDFLVVLYDRAGYGGSEPGPLPRDSAREADELKALLDTLSVPGPFVLVGHSLGGLNAQVYASRNPDDIAGLVLLDPPPLGWILGEGYPELRALAEQMTDEWQGMADGGNTSDDAVERARADFFRAIASEHREMFGASARQAAAIDTLAHTPLTVIASGVPNEMFGDVAEEYQKFWIEESRAIADRSSRGEFVLAEQSTHMLHRDAADVVLSAIRRTAERGASE